MADDAANKHRVTEEPQRVHGENANAEWKADPGLHDIVHGSQGTSQDTPLARAEKAAKPPSPDIANQHEEVIGGAPVLGHNQGKGGLEHDPHEKYVKDPITGIKHPRKND